MAREAMNGADLAWLRMDRPTNPMMIVAVLTLAGRVSRRALRSVLLERLLRFERFRELPVHDVLGTHWETDSRFDIDAHVRLLELKPRAGQAGLEAAASRLASKPLDPSRPLWQMHLVERYRKGSAIVARFHHCYADGIALMRVLLALADSAAGATGDDTAATSKPPPPSGVFALMSPFTDLLGSALSSAQSLSQGTLDLLGSSLQTLAHPDRAAALARRIADASRELADIASLPADPHTPLKRALSGKRRIAWAEPLSLAEVKTVSSALGCTINDVLLSTVAGALGSYLRQRAPSTGVDAIRALVPVNLRPPEEAARLGNEFGLVFATLPVGETHPLKRVYALTQEMNRLKHSSQALLSLWLLTGLGLLPETVEERVIELFTSKASLVISNVPGPREPLYLAGARIDEQHFWVPQAGSIGVGISLLSYDGRVHFGLTADRNLVPVPGEMARFFSREFERLVLCLLADPAVAAQRAVARISP